MLQRRRLEWMNDGRLAWLRYCFACSSFEQQSISTWLTNSIQILTECLSTINKSINQSNSWTNVWTKSVHRRLIGQTISTRLIFHPRITSFTCTCQTHIEWLNDRVNDEIVTQSMNWIMHVWWWITQRLAASIQRIIWFERLNQRMKSNIQPFNQRIKSNVQTVKCDAFIEHQHYISHHISFTHIVKSTEWKANMSSLAAHLIVWTNGSQLTMSFNCSTNSQIKRSNVQNVSSPILQALHTITIVQIIQSTKQSTD